VAALFRYFFIKSAGLSLNREIQVTQIHALRCNGIGTKAINSAGTGVLLHQQDFISLTIQVLFP
jgi:hypothetical protein